MGREMRLVDAAPIAEQLLSLAETAERKGDGRAAAALRHAVKLVEDAPTLVLRLPEEMKEVKEVRHKYGAYKNVLLSDAEMGKLRAEFPADLDARIEAVSEYVAGSGKKYRSFLAVIRNWARRDAAEAQPGGVSSFETDDFFAAAVKRTYEKKNE